MGRAPCCDKASVKKGPWSPVEDAKLKDFIEKHGIGGNWIALPHKAGLKRCGKSCRLRWLNYLRPNIKHGEFSEDEDRIICSLYASIGSRWSVIASQLPGRTDNDIKNYWNTKLKKKLLAMLPCIQKNSSFSPSINVQSPPLSDLHKQDGFLNNASSSFHNYNPNFMNVNNTINSLILSTTSNNHVQYHSNATDLFTQSVSPPASTAFIGMISDEKNYYGFQNHNMNKEKERMLMFGDQNHGITTYNKDDHRIKQEHQYAINVFENQTNGVMTDHKYFDQKQKGCFKNLEEVKQVIGINNNSGGISSSSINVDINGYLMNDDDENKTTHNITDGFYRMIDGSN